MWCYYLNNNEKETSELPENKTDEIFISFAAYQMHCQVTVGFFPISLLSLVLKVGVCKYEAILDFKEGISFIVKDAALNPSGNKERYK